MGKYHRGLFRNKFTGMGWCFPLTIISLALSGCLQEVSKPGTEVEVCLDQCARGDLPGNDFVRVMTLNVLHGFPTGKNRQRRLDLIASEIKRLHVDIACLQEVPWGPRMGSGVVYLSRRTSMNYVYLRANGNRNVIAFEEGVAILSRYPLKGTDFVELQPQPWFFEHRVALKATVVSPGGELDVVVAHLTLIDEDHNARQMQSLQVFVAGFDPGPVVVAGDFNTEERSAKMRTLPASWVDAYRAANPIAEGPTCCIGDLTGGPGEAPTRRIDYLFLISRGDGQMVLRTARRVFDQPFPNPDGWQWVSDHMGVMADIELRSPRFR